MFRLTPKSDPAAAVEPVSPCIVLWRAPARSIQEILESPSLLALRMAGAHPVRVFGVFPIATRYRTPAGTVSLELFPNRNDLCQALQNLDGTSFPVLTLDDGFSISREGFSALIAAHAAGTQPVGYRTQFTAHDSGTPAASGLTPWSTALCGAHLKQDPESWLSFLLDYAPPSAPLAFTTLDVECTLGDSRAAREYAAYSDPDAKIVADTEMFARSPYLLARYIKKQREHGDIAALDALPFQLLETCATSLADSDTLFAQHHRLWQMLENGRFSDMLSVTADIKNKAAHTFTAHLYEAIARANLGDFSGAQNCVSVALALKPDHHAAFFVRAHVFILQQNYRSARDILNNLGQHNLHDEEVIRALAWTQYRSGDISAAVKTLEYALNVFYFDARLFRLLLHLCYLSADLPRLNKYTRYIEAYPPLPADFPEKEWRIVREELGAPTPGGWVLDIGANEGLLTQALLSWGFPCLAVEPDKDLHPQLRAIIAPYPERAALCTDAVSDKEAHGTLIIGNTKGFNTLEPEVVQTLSHRFGSARGTQPVSLKTLDSILDEYAIAHVALLKLDVEGHELPALMGLDSTRLERIPLVFIEMEKRLAHKTRAVLYYLFAHGYHHGLVFQHDPIHPRQFTLQTLTAGDDLDLNESTGVYANVLLSREPFFSPNRSDFERTGSGLDAQLLRGRIHP